ncbi:COG2426 family protein [Proteocatella sphenisci]|uniref:COG2426 family protein n=1 Tax=Proteocatella sphenisci TaxID=181070 RepID=UPI00048F4ACB|nr:small multi-drug export protein [Proteocatella sphenisci]
MNIINPYLTVFLLAATPIIELRGAIPAGVALGLDPWTVYLLAVAGSSLPAPFLILFFRKILDFLEYKGWFKGLTDFLHNHVQKKAHKLKKASVLGLFLFVAIPLPSTGAYTGSVLASVFDIRLKYSFTAILAGNFAAGFIMMMISHIIL